MKSNHLMITESPPPPPPQSLNQLIQSLHQASHMANQLHTTSDVNHHRLIISSLHSTHLSLSSFLALHSSVVAESGGDELMAIGDGEEEEEAKESSMEGMEERMREIVCIRSKRQKRPLSPVDAAAGERQGLEERESIRATLKYDPRGNQSRSLELVYQFHA